MYFNKTLRELNVMNRIHSIQSEKKVEQAKWIFGLTLINSQIHFHSIERALHTFLKVHM